MSSVSKILGKTVLIWVHGVIVLIKCNHVAKHHSCLWTLYLPFGLLSAGGNVSIYIDFFFLRNVVVTKFDSEWCKR